MRSTIALIVASLNCAMHSTQCDAARFRQKPALLVTSLKSLLLFAQVVRQVCWALSMHASALRTSCACSLCTLQAPRWLVSITDRALIDPAIPTQSGQINHSA